MKKVSRCLIGDINTWIEGFKTTSNRDIRKITLNIAKDSFSRIRKWGITYNLKVEKELQTEGDSSVAMIEPYLFLTYKGAKETAQEVKRHYSQIGLDTEIIENPAS